MATPSGGATADDGPGAVTPTPGSRLSRAEVWREVGKASFAVLGFVTPSGEPRTAGIVYTTVGNRMFVVTGPDSYKARYIGASGQVSVTVTVRRGGVLTLLAPIPPATISFQGDAVVHAPGSDEVHAIADRLGRLLPDERRDSSALIEIAPKGAFVTYGIGISLSKLRDPAAATDRVPIG